MVYLSPFWLGWCDLWSIAQQFISCKLESYKKKATLVMTKAIKGSSTEKLYQELGIEYFR